MGAGRVFSGGVGSGRLQETHDGARAARHAMTSKAVVTVAEVIPKCSMMNLRSLLQLRLDGFMLFPREPGDRCRHGFKLILSAHAHPMALHRNSPNFYVVNVCPRVPPLILSIDTAEGYFYHCPSVRTQVKVQGLPTRVPNLAGAIGLHPLCISKLTN